MKVASSRCTEPHHRDRAFGEAAAPIRQGMAKIRIANDPETRLPPRKTYENATARSYAEQGYVEFAELIEAGYGCAACHLTHGLNRVPTDEEIDLARFEAVAIAGRAMRFVVEIGADAIMGASAQLEAVLARDVVHRIEARNVVDPSISPHVRTDKCRSKKPGRPRLRVSSSRWNDGSDAPVGQRNGEHAGVFGAASGV